MTRYNSPIDAFLGSLLLVGQLACVLILMATVCWSIADWEFGLDIKLIFRLIVPFVCMFTANWLLRRELFRMRYPTWAYCTALLGISLGMWAAFGWFQDPMHDIALAFGSHGRWGCGGNDAFGFPRYIIQDSTVPWILFTPMLLAISIHWYSRHRKLIFKILCRNQDQAHLNAGGKAG